jgi:2-polyprenyl-3-methyl-5-hydroxy-6-metoxy-1,4-benzoquinol methylase
MNYHLTDDEQNSLQAKSEWDVDQANAVFYGRFPYPWRALRLQRNLDTDFERVMLCQSIGDWSHRIIPRHSNIWVAGCGTNQAIITALKFPESTILASDLSRPSLDLCARTADELSVTNLELREESLNQVSYHEQFDYILCTGVIHHNSDPAMTLNRLSHALRPHGILELMVYNRFHRILPSAFQKAIRILAGSTIDPGSSIEVRLATSLIKKFPGDCQMAAFLRLHADSRPEKVADAMMQPIEHSYTVQTVCALAKSCNLELLAPSLNLIDKARNTTSWNLIFDCDELNKRYYELDDLRRWQVTNLLLCERSPMLWFYLKRIDRDVPPTSERDVCHDFLERRFLKAHARSLCYQLDDTGNYRSVDTTSMYPSPCRDARLRKVVESANGYTSMRDLLLRDGLCVSFPEVNEIRLGLTTPANPYLKSI